MEREGRHVCAERRQWHARGGRAYTLSVSTVRPFVADVAAFFVTLFRRTQMRFEQRITFRLSNDLRRAVTSATAAQRIKEGEFVRRAVQEALARRDLWRPEAAEQQQHRRPMAA